MTYDITKTPHYCPCCHEYFAVLLYYYKVPTSAPIAILDTKRSVLSKHVFKRFCVFRCVIELNRKTTLVHSGKSYKCTSKHEDCVLVDKGFLSCNIICLCIHMKDFLYLICTLGIFVFLNHAPGFLKLFLCGHLCVSVSVSVCVCVFTPKAINN